MRTRLVGLLWGWIGWRVPVGGWASEALLLPTTLGGLCPQVPELEIVGSAPTLVPRSPCPPHPLSCPPTALSEFSAPSTIGYAYYNSVL